MAWHSYVEMSLNSIGVKTASIKHVSAKYLFELKYYLECENKTSLQENILILKMKSYYSAISV